jgi:hypothetical protein
MPGGQSAAPNYRFDGSVAVNFVSASCRQCGNFGMRGTLNKAATRQLDTAVLTNSISLTLTPLFS